MSKNTLLFIDGVWRPGAAGRFIDILNPATGDTIGQVAKAEIADLDDALASAAKGFALWSQTPALERCKLLLKAAGYLRERSATIAPILTLEHGKPIGQAEFEMVFSAEVIEWLAEEGRRAYGRVIAPRAAGVHQFVTKDPVGPVAAFTPWNFPVIQIARKLGAALAAGCSIIVKAPEETPGSPAELIKCFEDAGIPPGVVNLIYGDPAEISSYLIPHPTIRKVSFTGSVPVGKHLASLAGLHMKRTTMELGGHAPVIVCDDADIKGSAQALAAAKFRNSGQVCTSPTRFLVQRKVYDQFLNEFVEGARNIRVGDGFAEGTVMGPLINERRLQAVQSLIADATSKGAEIATGGNRIGNVGSFYEPTVLVNLNNEMRAMNEEPFGPLALLLPFEDLQEALEEANRLPFGLAAYAFTRSGYRAAEITRSVQSGMLTINHFGLALPEVPFGGVRDSGYGSEGGTEALEAYQIPRFVTHMTLPDV